MSFWNKLFGKKGVVRYSVNTDLKPHLNDVDEDKNSKGEQTLDLTVPVGGSFSYTANIYGSVGVWWESQYDKCAFDVQLSTHYLDPERCNKMCGADEAVKTETFTALGSGDFEVIIIHDFRGRIEYVTTIRVRVC